jgi:hypothetical protein
VHGGEVQCDQDETTDILNASGLDMDVGDDGGLVVVVRQNSVTGGVGGGVGEGGSIRATTLRIQAWAVSNFFFASMMVATMASSFYRNSAA